MLSQEQVFEMIRLEAEYAKGWGKGSRKLSKVEGVADEDVHALAPLAGQPYSIMDFMTYAKKYWKDAEEGYAGFTPDGGVVRIRLLKVASLLVRALQVHGRPNDIERLAGKSSRNFPIMGGGLSTFDETTNAEGCMLPEVAKKLGLRNEAPGCDPLKK